ncbi:hypothetical protein JW835_09860 [bacterium]|nr:hypothetical protein [bacterium]
MKKKVIKKAGWSGFLLIFCGTALWIVLGNRAMKQSSDTIKNQLIQTIDTTKTFLDEVDLSSCPEPVQHYLRYAIPENQKRDILVQLKHAGYIQINLDTNFYEDPTWKYLIAEHIIRLDQPAFFWQGMIHLGWEFWLKGWYLYTRDNQQMLWTWMGSFPLIKRNELQIRINGLCQFLLQLPWYPTAMGPSDYLQWEAIDDTSARAIIISDGIKISGVFDFNREGKIIRLITDNMSRTTNSGFIHEQRMVKYVQYRKKDNYYLPRRMYFFWKTPEGWVSDADFRLEEIVYY